MKNSIKLEKNDSVEAILRSRPRFESPMKLAYNRKMISCPVEQLSSFIKDMDPGHLFSRTQGTDLITEKRLASTAVNLALLQIQYNQP
jgi:hypothetical protein